MRPYRIAHLSDFHLSADHRRINIRNTKRILQYVIKQGFDHLVITGDLTADAQKKDYQLARSVLSSHGLLSSDKLSVVIGNHDIFGGVHQAEDIFSFPKRCKKTDYNRKIEMFAEFFHESFEGTITGGGETPFPYGKIVGDVMLVGVNSIAEYSKTGNPIGSNGQVSPQELRRLRTLFASSPDAQRRKIVLIHHHFDKLDGAMQGTMHSLWEAIERQTMRLRGKKELVRLFKDNKVEMVLHGHVHENYEYVRKRMRCVNGGGSVIAQDSSVLKANFLNITERTIHTEIHRIPVDQKMEPNASESAQLQTTTNSAAA